MKMRLPFLTSLALGLAMRLVAAPALSRNPGPAYDVPPSGVIGIREAYLEPGFWVGRLTQSDRLLMDRDAIAAQNTKLQHLDPSMHDLRAISAPLDGGTVCGWLEAPSVRP